MAYNVARWAKETDSRLIIMGEFSNAPGRTWL